MAKGGRDERHTLFSPISLLVLFPFQPPWNQCLWRPPHTHWDSYVTKTAVKAGNGRKERTGGASPGPTRPPLHWLVSSCLRIVFSCSVQCRRSGKKESEIGKQAVRGVPVSATRLRERRRKKKKKTKRGVYVIIPLPLFGRLTSVERLFFFLFFPFSVTQSAQ